MKHLYDILEYHKASSKVALIDSHRQWTYQELYDYVEKYDWIGCADQAGPMNVAILIPNSIEYVVAYFAIARTGNIIVPIHSGATQYEIEREIRFCRIDTIFVSEATAPKIKEISGIQRVIIVNLDAKDTPYALSDSRAVYLHENRNSDLGQTWNNFYRSKSRQDIAILLHTSGTTGNPKKVMLSHANLLSNCLTHAKALGLTGDDRAIVALPLCFVSGNTCLLLCHLALGGTLIFAEPFFIPPRFLRMVDEARVTVFMATPSMLLGLLKYMLLKGPVPQQFDGSSLRLICVSGASMSAEAVQQLMLAFPKAQVIQVYGLTEAAPRVTALDCSNNRHKIGSVGRPVSGVRVQIVDESRKEVSQGVVGEVLVSGPNVMPGYYCGDHVSTEALYGDWLCTGDLGYLDEEGYLCLKGRKKNIILCAGVNLYPEEIEECLMFHPGIRNARVAGEHDSLYGEVPVAYVEAESGLSTDEIFSFCTRYLTSIKLPREIHIVDHLPTTATGKVARYNP